MGRKVRSFGHHSRFRNSMIFLLIAVMIIVGFAAVSPAWANDDSRISGNTIAADGTYNASVTAVPNTEEEGIRNLNDEVRVKVKDGVIEKISFKGVGTDPQTESNAADPAERSDVFSKALKELRKTNDPVGAAASESALKEIFEASDDQNETVREPAAGWLSGKKDPDHVYSVNLTQAIIKAVRSAEARETNEEEHEVKDKVHSKNVEKPQENTEKDSKDADTSVSENKTEQAAAADDERSAEMNVPAEENNADPAGSLEGSSGPAKIAAMNKIAAASGIREVSGNQIAKDGTYGAYFSVAKYEDGKYKKNYTGILWVVVSNGNISNLIYSGDKSSKISPVLQNSGYIGQAASVTVIQNASVDAVSSASLNTGGSASASRSGKSYVMDLKSTIITALQSADAAEGTTSETVQGVADGVYKGSSSNSKATGAEAEDKITVNVTVKDGKITDVAKVADETTGSWDSLLQTVKSEVVDTPAAASNVDAVSSATTKGWKAAVQGAIKNALNSKASEAGDDSGSSSGGTSVEKAASLDANDNDNNPEATIRVGETLNLTGTYNSLASPGYGTWSSSDNSIATVEQNGYDYNTYQSKAIVTGVKPGDVVVTHTVSGLFSSTTEKYTIHVVSGGGTSADTKNGTINVKVNWSNAQDAADSITVKLSALNEEEKTVTLNSANSWTAAATGLNINKTYGYSLSKITKDSQDVTDQYNWEGSTSEDGGTVTLTMTKKDSENSGGGVTPADPAKSANGLNLSKTADKQGEDVTADDTVTLTLEAESSGRTVSTGNASPVDVLLVLDWTSSMKNDNRYQQLQSAANTFINGLTEDNGSKIAAIRFGEKGYYSDSPVETISSWSDVKSSSKRTLINSINNLQFDDNGINKGNAGTSYLTALNRASSMLSSLDSGDNTKKYVIFFSDGDADQDTRDSVNSAASAVKNSATVFSIACGNFSDQTKIRSVSSDPSKYYYFASQASALTTAFNNALTTIENESKSSTTLDSSAVFKDVVNTDKFDVSDATAKVSIYDYDAGGWNVLSNASASAKAGSTGTLSSWTRKATSDGPLTIKFDKSTGAVTVTGFSYKDHYLPASGTEASGVNAQKLHVEISGLKLKAGAQTSEVQNDVHTNKDSESGISKKDGSLVANFPEPSVNIPAKEVKTTTLTVKQQINGDDPDTDKTFSFTAKITPESGETETKTFALKHNETSALTVPAGAQVEITQGEDTDYYLSKVDETSGIDGTIDFTGRVYSVTAPETSETVTFINAKNESHADAATGNDSVVVHKTVSKNEGDGDNEFTVNLSVDAKTNVAKYYTKYFKEKAKYGEATSPNDEKTIGEVYSNLSGNLGNTVSTEPVGQAKSGTFTIYASDKKTVLVSGLKLYWSKANNVCFYAEMPNGQYLVLGTRVGKDNINNKAVYLSTSAEKVMEDAIKSSATTVDLKSVTDVMGAYITYNDSVSENGQSNPTNVSYDENSKMLTWTAPNKNPSAQTNLVNETTTQDGETRTVQVYETKNYATLSYKVKLDVDKSGFKNASTGETVLNGYHTGSSAGKGSLNAAYASADSGSGTVDGNWYNTNDHATLTYRTSADTTDQTIDFPTPLVQGTKPDVPLTGTNTRQPAAWILLALCLAGAAYLIWRRRRSI